MRRLADAREQVEVWRGVETNARETLELQHLAQAEGDKALAAAVTADLDKLTAQLDALELTLAFSGEYDRRNAILAIHAGAGGTDSQDWTGMLLRMYLRWAEKRDYRTAILDMTPGEEAGIKSVTVEVTGRNAYGYLRAERGVHRLVRLSPFDAAHARHTSFAPAEVLPEVESAAHPLRECARHLLRNAQHARDHARRDLLRVVHGSVRLPVLDEAVAGDHGERIADGREGHLLGAAVDDHGATLRPIPPERLARETLPRLHPLVVVELVVRPRLPVVEQRGFDRR
ncbi:hypothetical protein LCGC14_2087790, partial [marine sediment metagenome]